MNTNRNLRILTLVALLFVAQTYYSPQAIDCTGIGHIQKMDTAGLYTCSADSGGGDISAAWPIGSVFTSVVSTNPGTLLGFGTWVSVGAGRVLVGLDSGDTAFDTVEETGGAKTVAAAGTNSTPTFTGTPFTAIINHTHPVTDPGHNHIQDSHNHTQNAHSHTVTSVGSGATGGTTNLTGASDTSSTTATAANATATNQAATATNQSATTGVTTTNPVGGVASITPAGTVTAPTFTGSATSVVQPYFVVYFWKRTA